MNTEQFQSIVDELKEDHGLIIKLGSYTDTTFAVYKVTPEEIQRLNYLTGVTHIITNVMRTNGIKFLYDVEMTLFRPGTPANQQCTFYVIRWLDVPWWMLTIPSWRIGAVDELAKKYDFTLRRTVPTVKNQDNVYIQGSLSLDRKEMMQEWLWFPVEQNTCTVEKTKSGLSEMVFM